MTETERKLQMQVNLLTTTNEVLAEKLAAAETAHAAKLAYIRELEDANTPEITALTDRVKALEAAEAGALAQTDSIDTMRKTVALYRDTARTNRLLVEKLVKSRIADHKAAEAAKEEATRARIQAEEQAKAEARAEGDAA